MGLGYSSQPYKVMKNCLRFNRNFNYLLFIYFQNYCENFTKGNDTGYNAYTNY